jgi:hypothetical protein
MKNIKNTILLVFTLYATSLSTKHTILKVYQPILTANGIEISITTYLKYLGFPAGTHVMLTCAENMVFVEDQPVNSNCANIYDFKIELILNNHGFEMFGDTLKARLVIPDNFQERIIDQPINVNELVKTTVECLKLNAFSYSFINFLYLEVAGSYKFEEYSNLYTK